MLQYHFAVTVAASLETRLFKVFEIFLQFKLFKGLVKCKMSGM